MDASAALHLSPLIDATIQAVELYVIPPVALAVGAWLAAKFGSKLTADKKAALAATISGIADKAAQFAAAHAATAIANKGPLDVTIGDPRVAAFGNFMIGQAADVLKKAGTDTKVDPVTGKLPAATVDTLQRLALARLPAKTAEELATDALNAAQLKGH